jgi:hypothetical protein
MTAIERLKELVKEWRERADKHWAEVPGHPSTTNPTAGRAFDKCADTLEQVIREMEGKG